METIGEPGRTTDDFGDGAVEDRRKERLLTRWTGLTMRDRSFWGFFFIVEINGRFL